MPRPRFPDRGVSAGSPGAVLASWLVALGLGSWAAARAQAGAASFLAPPLVLATSSRATRGLALAALIGLLTTTAPGADAPPLGTFRAVAAPAAPNGLYHVRARCLEADLVAVGTQRVRVEIAERGGVELARPEVAVWHLEPRPGLIQGLAPGDRIAATERVERQRSRIAHATAWRRIASGSGLARFVHDHRAAAAQRLDRLLPSRTAPWARALILGDRSAIRRDELEAFRATGQAHILAVSGFHVALVVAFALVVVRLIGAGPRGQALAAVPVILVYVPLAGAAASAVRAGAAAALVLFARASGRLGGARPTLIATALLLLATDAGRTADLGAWLSFVAVAGLLLLTRPITTALIPPPDLVIPGWLPAPRAPIRRALAVSFAAWASTAPWIALVFGRIAFVGPFLTVLIVPAISLLLAAGLLLLLVGDVPPLAWPCSAIVTLCADLVGVALRGVVACGLDDAAARATPWNLVAFALAFPVLATQRDARGARRALGVVAVCIAFLRIDATAALPTTAEGYDPAPVSLDAALCLAAPKVPSLPALIAIAAGGAAAVACAAHFARWLTARAAALAWALGIGATAVLGVEALGALLVTFVVATLAGKLPGRTRAGPRDARQVVANGLPAALGVVVAAAGMADVGLAMFLGGLSCLGADTCSTELGMRYGGVPRDLLTARPVRSGESGGVTAVGLLASLGGGLLAPVTHLVAAGSNARLAAWAAAAGVAGGLLDSVIGSRWQHRARVPGDDRIVEPRLGDATNLERVRGLRGLDNDVVNLASGLVAAVLSAAAVSIAR